MRTEILQRVRHAVLLQIRRTCHRNLLQARHAPDHQAGVTRFARAQHAVVAFAHEIDGAVAHADSNSICGYSAQNSGSRGRMKCIASDSCKSMRTLPRGLEAAALKADSVSSRSAISCTQRA